MLVEYCAFQGAIDEQGLAGMHVVGILLRGTIR